MLLSKMQTGCGIVIGSRYCRGGEITGWLCTRKIVSRTANLVAEFLVGLKLRALTDCTSGSAAIQPTLYEQQSRVCKVKPTIFKSKSCGKLFPRISVEKKPQYCFNRKHAKSKLSLAEIQSYISYAFKTAMHGQRR